MPQTFRRLFSTLLAHCELTDVRKLWEIYFQTMSDDYRKSGDMNLEIQIHLTLIDLRQYLESMGKNIINYDLPAIRSHSFEAISRNTKEILDEETIEIPMEDIDVVSHLNPEQKQTYDKTLERVTSKKSWVIFFLFFLFVDGSGETGKTFLYQTLFATIRANEMIALTTSTSRVAAAIMSDNRTAHSCFNIPLQTTYCSMCAISKQSSKAELLRKTRIIIWDEAAMAKRFVIETVDRTFMDIMGRVANHLEERFLFLVGTFVKLFQWSCVQQGRKQ